MTGWQVTDHSVGKLSAIGQPTRPTQSSVCPWLVSEYSVVIHVFTWLRKRRPLNGSHSPWALVIIFLIWRRWQCSGISRIAPSAGKNQGSFAAGSLWVIKADWKQQVLKWCLKAVSDRVFQILETETMKAHEPKLRLWFGTDCKKEAEERINLVGLWCCKRLARYSGEPVCVALRVAIVSLLLPSSVLLHRV